MLAAAATRLLSGSRSAVQVWSGLAGQGGEMLIPADRLLPLTDRIGARDRRWDV
jgi:hypothetical protein